jgi:hypothetical protein
MLRALICLLLFAASVPVVAGAQDAPPIPVAKISLPDPAYVWMLDAGQFANQLHDPLSLQHDSKRLQLQ